MFSSLFKKKKKKKKKKKINFRAIFSVLTLVYLYKYLERKFPQI